MKPSEHGLLLTEPLFNPDSLKKIMYEMVFEEYLFKSLYCCSAPSMALHGYVHANPTSSFAKSVAHTVIDTGYSFSHIVPFFDRQKLILPQKGLMLAVKA